MDLQNARRGDLDALEHHLQVVGIGGDFQGDFLGRIISVAMFFMQNHKMLNDFVK